ncbi:MAG TPA: type II secretion system protein GspL, partial [Gammaproteobacteria bacterium]|nr:type II secretion system protein GspL [Gammaproteobacteria bacterium]
NVIVPGEEVLVTAVDLPKMPRARLREALPFALEEKLISDVNELHFAIGEYTPGESTPVVIVKKQKMEAWLQILNNAGLTPRTFIPAMFAIPDHWHICLDEKIAIVRTGKYSGFSCDLHNLKNFLMLELEKQMSKPECLHLHRFQHQDIKLDFDSVPVNEIKNDKDFLSCLQKWILLYPHIDLLQGSFEKKEKQFFLKKSWTITCILAIIWIGILLGNHITSYFMLNHAMLESDKEITKIYKTHFPNATEVVAPRDRMMSELKKFSQQSDNVFFTLLAEIGAGLQKNPDIELMHVDYRNNHLTLNMLAKTFDHLDLFIKFLSEKGLSVKQQNASTANGTVKANLIIGANT